MHKSVKNQHVGGKYVRPASMFPYVNIAMLTEAYTMKRVPRMVSILFRLPQVAHARRSTSTAESERGFEIISEDLRTMN